MVKLTYTKKKENWRISLMQMVKLVCPHCGATLSIENVIDTFYCQYCGRKIMLTGQDKKTINAKVKLKEFEHRERLQQNQQAYQERVQKRNQKHELEKMEAKGQALFLFGIAAILLVVGIILLILK